MTNLIPICDTACPYVLNPNEIDSPCCKPINYKDLGGPKDYIFFEHTTTDNKIEKVQHCSLVGRKKDIFECYNESEWKYCIHYQSQKRWEASQAKEGAV